MLDFINQLNDDALLDYIYDPFAYLDDELMHYGVGHEDDPPGRGSGRYGYGTGENPLQHEESLKARVAQLKKQGVTGGGDIARALGYKSSGELRKALSIEDDRRKEAMMTVVPEMVKKDMTVKEIAEKLGVSQTTVRNYISGKKQVQTNRTNVVADALRDELKTKHYIDVSDGVEHSMNCSKERLGTALKQLEDEGYHIHTVKVPQLGNPAHKTTIKVLGDKDTTWAQVANNYSLIQPFDSRIIGDGEQRQGLKKPKSIDSSRVYINYTDDSGHGGAEKDGLIELRRGVEDISLGKSLYSQVRIGVDDTHYMKGMAVYSDNIPEGYDIIYNTNKKYGTPKEDVFKPMQTRKNADGTETINWDNPFGATIMRNGQRTYTDKDGNEQLSVINKVNDEGKWGEWSKTVSSQILSKQPTPLVKKQLDVTYDDKVDEYNEIISLTNPTVKRKLLKAFAEDCDASACHLKAKAFNRQGSYAILPVPSLKGGEEYYKKNGIDGEIYAPRFENGEKLALFRHPHASISEIPIVRVNNKNPEARKMIGNAPDAVGINAHIAEKLSGADFDGDTVVIIPMKSANINSAPTLEGLKNFNPKDYKFKDPNAKGITAGGKQMQMGITTNLIADMSFRDGVTQDEMARVIRHSMVVIDSYKHHLDWKQSELDNDIQGLKDKYQANPGRKSGGAHTIITKADSSTWINDRRPAKVIDEKTGKQIGYGIDPRTGKQVWEYTGRTKKVFSPTKKDPKRVIEKELKEELPLMMVTEDARDLMSSRDNPHPTELAYANYANKLKALANKARKTMVEVPRLKKDPEAEKLYSKEVDSLKRKLILAQSNAPRERMAQIAANTRYKDAIKSNPSLKEDKDHLKRLRGQLLTGARLDYGASKSYIDITDKEWEAIQHRAISETTLQKILENARDERVRELATPHQTKSIPANVKSAIRAMGSRPNGPSIAEIAAQFGISTSSVSGILSESKAS